MILASIFRDSAEYVDRYVNQVKALREIMPVTVIAVEGDSTDDTYDRLLDTDFTVLKVETGGPRYSSVAWKPRWRQLAACGNVALVKADLFARADPDTAFCYVESDLIWTTETIASLVDDLNLVSAVAPMSMVGDRFYDTWGHTVYGKLFSPTLPYFEGYNPTELTPIDTAGSCFVVHASLLPDINFSPVDCIRGIGRSIDRSGRRLWLDPRVRVEHEGPT